MSLKKDILTSVKLMAVMLVMLFSNAAMGSHIVGGEVAYKYLGPDTGGNLYQVSLTIYENCVDPNPGAIAGDNPAYLSVFSTVKPYTNYRVDPVTYSSFEIVPANFSNVCISNAPELCLIKKTFIINYVLRANTTGYLIAYQRCCRNGAISNIMDPGQTGSTYYCVIPGTMINTSAVFTNYPPQIICLNTPLLYDNSATDDDGDSLTYEFCNCLDGGQDTIPKASPPPYDSVIWLPGYSPTNPLTGFPPIVINPKTGIISGTPNREGRYLLTVCCHEWRHGVMINTIKREFQFLVTNCSKSTVACIPQYSKDPNTFIVDCADFTVNFINCSIGGITWHWDFGIPGLANDTSNSFQPTYTYPDTGTYIVKLVVNPGTTCQDSTFRYVKIYPTFKAGFIDTGKHCPGDSLQFLDKSIASIKPVTNWLWYFGDGDSALTQNPKHNYAYGGIYNVILVSENIKSCIDTVSGQVAVEEFKPYAGDDTIIVRGEHILFNALGGTTYLWSPATNLSDSTIFDPIGYFQDTGSFTYNVWVRSPFGCLGSDSINVKVVNQAEFFVPRAFTPNGDGYNDYFRPLAVGYRELLYFRVFNRWGELVYSTQSLEVGWDGTYNSHICDMGSYYWEILFVDRFGAKGFMKGDVTLIK